MGFTSRDTQHAQLGYCSRRQHGALAEKSEATMALDYCRTALSFVAVALELGVRKRLHFRVRVLRFRYLSARSRGEMSNLIHCNAGREQKP